MQTLADISALLLILVVSITCHEFMHAYVSYRLGDDTAKIEGRISLNPLVHVDPLLTILMPIVLFLLAGFPIIAAKPVPFNPYRLKYGDKGAALVAIAGPLTNLGLAMFVAMWLRLLPVDSVLTGFSQLFVTINIILFVFNMIPFPPLDGSRLLYAFAPESLRFVMRQIENFGVFSVVILLFVLYPVISPVIGGAVDGILGLLLSGFSLSNLR